MIRKIGSLVCIAMLGIASAVAEEEYRYLPVGYTQVEFLKSSDGAYINTEIAATTALTAAMDFIPHEHTGGANVGSQTDDGADWRFFNYDGGSMFDVGNLRLGFNGGTVEDKNGGTKLTNDRRYLLEFGLDLSGMSKQYYRICDAESNELYRTSTTTSGGVKAGEQVYLFGGKKGDGANTASMTLYSFFVWDGGTLVGDFVPCIKGDGQVPGLYDLVSEKFYANASGSGTFTCGNEVPVPDPNMPRIASVSAAWKDGATELTVTLAAGFGAVSAVFTDVETSEEYPVSLAENLDAREGEVTGTYTISAATLPAEKTYAWSVTVKNPDIELPATMVSKAKYYTGDADATVRYVSTTGSDESNGLLLSTAKATLQAAIDALGDEGGTVYIDDGDYAFTSDTDTAVVITTAVHVVGLSRDASKVTITRTGTPARNFVLNHKDCSLEFVTVAGGTLRSDKGVSVSLRQGLLADCVICDADGRDWQCHGAVFADGTSHIVRCVFRGNKGHYDGSALQARGSAVIENCLFTDNESVGGVEHGGGTVNLGDSVRFVNCTVVGNRGLKSSGVYVNSVNARVQNCAIFGNKADSDGTGRGHIWYGNAVSFVNCAAEAEINENCPARAPGFRDALNNDYTLGPASELIDAGLAYSETAATSATDLAGNAREVDTVDIGCYEYTKNELDVGFTESVKTGLAPVEVTFSATVFGATGDITYEWDFDNDGTFDETTTEGTVTHTYERAGLYSIALKVTTESGATKSATLVNEVLVSPTIVYADIANEAGAAYPYDTPGTATPDLALAIATAGDGSTVLVADGTYRPSDATGFVIDKPVTVRSVSGDPAKCVLQESTSSGDRRVVTVNHAKAVLAGFTLDGGERTGNDGDGATLKFGDLGGTVTDCVIRGGRASNWGGDAALALVTAAGRVTHSIFEAGLALDDFDVKNSRPKTSNIKVCGQVDNCLIRNFNRDADNQNILLVNNGGRLLNCTVVDGLCGSSRADANNPATPCYGVRAESGARVENCAIVGVRDSDGGVRAWTGDPDAFANCATDTAETINETCFAVTTAAFKDYANGDYRPMTGSPLLNKGANNELADGTDLSGLKRRIGRMDIGCYEFNRAGMSVFIR